MREFTEVEEEKLMTALEFYLSLNEADIIFNMIFGPNTKEDVEQQLYHYCQSDIDVDF
jgi:hypothetical protein